VSKAALDHLNRIWAAELPAGLVRFFSVDPGEMDTEMHAAAIPDAERSALVPPAQAARRIARLIGDGERIESGARIVLSEVP
jgi:NAD(P)-dependent dehydrogenase (short-subunit alcohol dehydrogenase family)